MSAADGVIARYRETGTPASRAEALSGGKTALRRHAVVKRVKHPGRVTAE
jgi:hypothetical protein